MKKRNKILRYVCAAAVWLGVLGAGAVVEAHACTAVYVGSDASEDGTTMLAKSNDYQDVWPNYMTITERVENESGRSMPVDNDKTVYAEIPATTYKYTSTPWMSSATAENGLGDDATVCTNECGVSMVMSITAFSNNAALEADPLIENGLTEFTADDLVICQSSTAREAVDVLLNLIDLYGSSEVNIALISDQTEAWYIEMYGGHQYAAVKLPSDQVAAFGNEFSLEYLSDYEDYIFSPQLESLAVENNFAVYGDNGELNLYATYSGDSIRTDYSHLRTWIAHQVLAPSQYGDYVKEDFYPLCFTPDEKVSLQDVMEVMRNRYEGTEYSPDETGRTDVRVIGTDTALSVHIAQTYPNLPAEMACVTWESTGPCTYGVFVPLSNAATSVSEAYSRNQQEYGEFDMANYPYYRFKELATLCTGKPNYLIYGAPVHAYWSEAESLMIDTLADVLETASGMEDSKKASQYITDYCNKVQTQAFEDAGDILNTVFLYKSKNSNTMKNGRNPETGEILDERKEIDPIVITLDASSYGEIESQTGETTAVSFQPYLLGGAVVLVIAAVIVAAVLLRKKGK